ncbi:MAG: hypothetical protein HC847_24815 [Hydrococcus sp. RU_2_2]|nr:hypothetical protein [Hydrococcus sp. RU_2_2]NJP21537.1 hypothetical protein [Hydrococcus sp. CRU_1_1]NJQ98449.1 hypothetical protein [Hydrococcus sp. CSU_1_8]
MVGNLITTKNGAKPHSPPWLHQSNNEWKRYQFLSLARSAHKLDSHSKAARIIHLTARKLL